MQAFVYAVVSVHLPPLEPINIGVLLFDPVYDELYFRFQAMPMMPTGAIDPVDAAIINGFPDYCLSIAAERGAAGLLRHILDSASNTIRISDRLLWPAASAQQALEEAFSAHVIETD